MMSDTAPIPPPIPLVPKDPLLGMKLGDYVVESLLATGGMGLVYRAKQPLLGKSAAVKVLREEYARDDEQVSRFLKEAQAISAIHHRGIIDVLTFGNLPDGRQYMVMEFLDGETLEAVLGRDAPLPPARALPILDEVLDALSAAHKVGVVHRDLKPSNVFITRESNGTRYAKLVDFGLAKQTPVTQAVGSREAKASLVAGTPEYISPEQARGLVATPQTDLYCFGVMAFEVLTGKLPFGATTVDGLLQQHVNDLAPRMSALQVNLPEALDDLIAQCLEKEPTSRPQSADVVRQVVGRVMKQIKEDSTRQAYVPLPPVSAVPPVRSTAVVPKSPSEEMKMVRPSRAPLVLALLFFFFGAGLLTWAFWPGGETAGLGGKPTARPDPEPSRRVEGLLKTRPEVVPMVVTEPADDLAALDPKAAPVKKVEPPAKPEKPLVVVMADGVPPKIARVECEPTDAWKKSIVSDLQKLGTEAAKRQFDWSDEEESNLAKRINAAASSNECAAAQNDFEKLRKAVINF